MGADGNMNHINRLNTISTRKKDKNTNIFFNKTLLFKTINVIQADSKEREEQQALEERYYQFVSNPENDCIKSKLSKARCVIGYCLVKCWIDFHNNMANKIETKDRTISAVFTPYKPKKYWHNLLLYGLYNVEKDFLDNLFPVYNKVHEYGVGGTFGEIAILEGGYRKAGIFCDKDTEFAVITKNNENDFLFLYRALQKDKEKALSCLKPFEYWIRKDSLSTTFQYFEQETRRIGSFIYSKGDPVSHIYVLVEGDVEISLRREERGEDEYTINIDNRHHAYRYQYKRMISEIYMFGVEELIYRGGAAARVFDARVRSAVCTFYKLKVVDIMNYLCKNSPSFIHDLHIYSCIDNRMIHKGKGGLQDTDIHRICMNINSNRDTIASLRYFERRSANDGGEMENEEGVDRKKERSRDIRVRKGKGSNEIPQMSGVKGRVVLKDNICTEKDNSVSEMRSISHEIGKLLQTNSSRNSSTKKKQGSSTTNSTIGVLSNRSQYRISSSSLSTVYNRSAIYNMIKTTIINSNNNII